MLKRHFLIISIIYFAICLFYYFRMTAMTDPGFPLDDSWIHQVFARNIATGYGFSFNPGVPMSGATAPLWPLLLVPIQAILGPIASGLILGMLLQGLALIAIYKLAKLLTDNDNIALFSSILSILFWPVIWGAMSGMETGLFSALSLWGMYFFFRGERFDDRRIYMAYALFSLSFLSRPECALFVAAAVIHDFVVYIKSDEKCITPWLLRFSIIAFIIAPYFTFNYYSAGNIFPNTFSAKVMGRGLITSVSRFDIKGILHSLTVNPYFYLQHFYRNVILINPIVVLALVPGVLKLTAYRDNKRSKRIMLIWLFLLYVPLMGTFSPVLSATWQNYRYITNLLPIMIIIGFTGLIWETEIKFDKFKKVLLITSILLASAGMSMALFFGYFQRIIIPYLVTNAWQLTDDYFLYLTEVIARVGMGTLILAAMVLIGYLYTVYNIDRCIIFKRMKNYIITIMLIGVSFLTIYKAQYYANNVRNINECDVASGKFLAEIANPGDVVAVNDIGAIGYYSNMEVFDLWGLISKELTVKMIKNDSLIFNYMMEYKKVDYLVIAPDWFLYLSKRTDIFHPIAELVTDNNTILAQDRNIIYKVFWPDSVRAEKQLLE